MVSGPADNPFYLQLDPVPQDGSIEQKVQQPTPLSVERKGPFLATI